MCPLTQDTRPCGRRMHHHNRIMPCLTAIIDRLHWHILFYMGFSPFPLIIILSTGIVQCKTDPEWMIQAQQTCLIFSTFCQSGSPFLGLVKSSSEITQFFFFYPCVLKFLQWLASGVHIGSAKHCQTSQMLLSPGVISSDGGNPDGCDFFSCV